MTARLSKLVDAALGPLPSVTDFVEFLRTSARRTGDVPAPDPVHGMLLQGVNAKPSGSARAEQTALARALEFVDVCAHLDAKYANLDAWFVGWGAWAIQAELLFDTEEKREECLAQRAATIASALAVGVQLKGSVLAPTSFRTYANALSRLQGTTTALRQYVPSSVKQFPEFNIFMDCVLKREKARQAVHVAMRGQPGILQDDELAVVVETTKQGSSPFADQRTNILVFAFRTGLRSEVLRRLCVDSFVESKTEDGKRMVTMVMGTMKNKPASMQKVDATMFKQVIVEGANPDTCALKALDRQRALVEKAPLHSLPITPVKKSVV